MGLKKRSTYLRSRKATNSFLLAERKQDSTLLIGQEQAQVRVRLAFSHRHSNVPKENTMPAKLSTDIIRLIDGRNFAHLATLLPDGSPHSAPVWIGREGDRLFIATDDNSVKGRNTQRDPRVAVSLVDLDDPYSEAQIRGRVIERRRDSNFKYIDAVSRKYVGKPWPYREDVPVALIIEPDHVHYSKQPFEHEKAA